MLWIHPIVWRKIKNRTIFYFFPAIFGWKVSAIWSRIWLQPFRCCSCSSSSS
jgi:hypothetical protein